MILPQEKKLNDQGYARIQSSSYSTKGTPFGCMEKLLGWAVVIGVIALLIEQMTQG